MDLTTFRASLSDDSPPANVTGPLLALWWDGHGDWDRAHGCAQDCEGADAAWVHAYLHRKEGDPSNAAYWYGRADREPATVSLDDEWGAIAGALITR